MRSQGQVVKWFDDKGYGFVAAQASGTEVFLHVRDLPRTGRRPVVGDRLQFDVDSDAQGRKRKKKKRGDIVVAGGSETEGDGEVKSLQKTMNTFQESMRSMQAAMQLMATRSSPASTTATTTTPSSEQAERVAQRSTA